MRYIVTICSHRLRSKKGGRAIGRLLIIKASRILEPQRTEVMLLHKNQWSDITPKGKRICFNNLAINAINRRCLGGHGAGKIFPAGRKRATRGRRAFIRDSDL